MLALAWANLTHHKLRTALSVLALSIALAMFMVSKGLAEGSIQEVASRMEGVQAEILVRPAQENMVFSGGVPFVAAFEPHLRNLSDDNGPFAQDVIPVVWSQVKMGGQSQRVFGVSPDHMEAFLGPRKVLEGSLFDRANDLAARVDELRQTHEETNVSRFLTDNDHEDGCELVIDDVLRTVGNGERPYQIGDVIPIMGREFRIVGIVEAGVAGRVFAPIETMRNILCGGEQRASIFFVRLRNGLDAKAALKAFEIGAGSEAKAQLTSDYGDTLKKELDRVYMYINATNAMALIVCFLFILLTMYTFVIERTREIGILKALGVSRTGLMRLSIIEATIISVTGTAVGIGFAFLAKVGIAAKLPLLTVDLSIPLLLIALGIGIGGGLASAIYPGWRAAKLQPALALSYE